jgi:hypothetical protein
MRRCLATIWTDAETQPHQAATKLTMPGLAIGDARNAAAGPGYPCSRSPSTRAASWRPGTNARCPFRARIGLKVQAAFDALRIPVDAVQQAYY